MVAAGQREIEAEMIFEAREEVGAADVREETDADLRHAEAIALAGDAMRAVERDADAAAETGGR